jgi:hypothetical protein
MYSYYNSLGDFFIIRMSKLTAKSNTIIIAKTRQITNIWVVFSVWVFNFFGIWVSVSVVNKSIYNFENTNLSEEEEVLTLVCQCVTKKIKLITKC